MSTVAYWLSTVDRVERHTTQAVIGVV